VDHGGGVTSESTLELVRRAQDGSVDALERLARLYAPLIASEVGRCGRGAGRADSCLSAEDLRQEASVMLVQLVKEFSPGAGVAFGSYLKQKLRWRLHNYLRRGRARVVASTGIDSPEVMQLADQMEQVQGFDLKNPHLRAAFRQLSPRQRTVLIKMFWEDKRVHEVARELGITSQAASALQRRALKSLRKNIAAG